MSDRIALAQVKKVFPDATRAWHIGYCDSCKKHLVDSYFYIVGNTSVDRDGFVQGGFYCKDCGFRNAGSMHIDALLK
jgi:hypothetical protein